MTTRTKGRMCTGKRRYATKAAANDALWTLIRSGRAYDGQMRVYKCRHCDGHHMGHRGKGKR